MFIRTSVLDRDCRNLPAGDGYQRFLSHFLRKTTFNQVCNSLTIDGAATRLQENFNYSVAGLTGFVRAGRLTQGQANALGRRAGEPSLPLERQRAIANLVYSKRMGNNGPTDGWFYRGRGLIQITGLNNYRDCGNGLKVDLVKQPELLAQDEYAARSAAWFFASKGCMKYTGDLVRVTQIINGGQNGIDDRRARYITASKVLSL
ncbi:glycoside hydrolase family 19 protein [Enterobacter asburiae]|uniref:glycoside hydrolase family 19 protein n=1 Tax=Enterobacter asburiae TaxID=61645 RepID=UPI002A36406D|nr:glycoside hydrolase family 19 protein [Enterobacter asburiae]